MTTIELKTNPVQIKNSWNIVGIDGDWIRLENTEMKKLFTEIKVEEMTQESYDIWMDENIEV